MTDVFTRLWFILLLAVEGVIILDWEMKRFMEDFPSSVSLSLPVEPREKNSIEPPSPGFIDGAILFSFVYRRESKLRRS